MGRALSLPARPARCLWPAAAGRVSCCSHRVARAPRCWPRSSAGSPARTRGAAGTAAAARAIAGPGAGHPAQVPPPTHTHPRGNSWPGSCGGGAEEADAHCFTSQFPAGHRARSRVPNELPTPPTSGLAWLCAQRRSRVPRAERAGPDRRPGERTGARPGQTEPCRGGGRRAFRVTSREPQKCGDISELRMAGASRFVVTGNVGGFREKVALPPRSRTSGANTPAPWERGPPVGVGLPGSLLSSCYPRGGTPGTCFPGVPRAISAGGPGGDLPAVSLCFKRWSLCPPDVHPPPAWSPAGLLLGSRPGVGAACGAQRGLAQGCWRHEKPPRVVLPRRLCRAPPLGPTCSLQVCSALAQARQLAREGVGGTSILIKLICPQLPRPGNCRLEVPELSAAFTPGPMHFF